MKKGLFIFIRILIHAALIGGCLTMIIFGYDLQNTPMSADDWFEKASLGGFMFTFGIFLMVVSNFIAFYVGQVLYFKKFGPKPVAKPATSVAQTNSEFQSGLKPTKKCEFCNCEIKDTESICPHCGGNSFIDL